MTMLQTRNTNPVLAANVNDNTLIMETACMTRTRCSLDSVGIKTIGQLKKLTRQRFLAIRNIGELCLFDIEHNLGVTLKDTFLPRLIIDEEQKAIVLPNNVNMRFAMNGVRHLDYYAYEGMIWANYGNYVGVGVTKHDARISYVQNKLKFHKMRKEDLIHLFNHAKYIVNK